PRYSNHPRKRPARARSRPRDSWQDGCTPTLPEGCSRAPAQGHPGIAGGASRLAMTGAGLQESRAMTVASAMSRDPSTIRPDATLVEASEVMRTRGIHHLPVVREGGRLIGILTDRDLTPVSNPIQLTAFLAHRTVSAAPLTSNPLVARIQARVGAR